MAFIIPDKILEKLICDSCHKYLSVKPIKIFPNRRIKCGRCCRSKNQSDGVVSLYGVIANKCLFKCINRFDGCKMLLTYSHVRDHEKVCISKQYKCPICPESMDIPIYVMKKHFNENHKDAILDHPGFYLKLDLLYESSVTYLYQQNDKLFFIISTSSPFEEKIELNALYLGDSNDAKKINQQFTVSTDNDSDIILEPKPCSAYLSTDYDNFSINLPDKAKTVFIKFSITDDHESLIKLPESMNLNTTRDVIRSSADVYTFVPMAREGRAWKMFLTSQFIHRYPDFLLTPLANAFTVRNANRTYFINCSNCQELCWRGQSQEILVQRFYCHKRLNHSICYYCFQYLKHKKEVSDDDYTNKEFPIEMVSFLQFFCKWNCGEVFDALPHLVHEHTCKQSPLLACPDRCCNFKGTIAEIASHITVHPNSVVYTYSSFIVSSFFNKKIYVYLNEQFVWFEIEVRFNTNAYITAGMVYTHGMIEKQKPVIILFDSNKQFEKLGRNYTIFDGNYWVKLILVEA